MDLKVTVLGKARCLRVVPKRVFDPEPNVGLNSPWAEEYRAFHTPSGRELTPQEYCSLLPSEEEWIIDSINERLANEHLGL